MEEALLGAWALGWPPGLGEDCRAMKEGSLERPPEPAPAETAVACRHSSSGSKDRDAEGGQGEEREQEGEGEREEEEEEGEEGEEGEAAAKTCGEEGGEVEPAALELVGLDIRLAGRRAAEGFLGPWLVEALLLGGVLLGSGAVGVAARRPGRFRLRWSSWHWAPRGHTPLREKSGHSSVCFFLHLAPRGQ